MLAILLAEILLCSMVVTTVTDHERIGVVSEKLEVFYMINLLRKTKNRPWSECSNVSIVVSILGRSSRG